MAMVHAAALLALVGLVAATLVADLGGAGGLGPKAIGAEVSASKAPPTTDGAEAPPSTARPFPRIVRLATTTTTTVARTSSTSTSASGGAATSAPTALPATGAPAAPPTPAAPQPRVAVPGLVTLIGDSVTLGVDLSGEIAGHFAHANVDAVVSRQLGEADDVVAAHLAAGTLGQTVVIALGTNGVGTGADVDAVMAAVAGAGVERVVFVNIRAPRPWEASMNVTISEGAARHGAVVADWYSVGVAHPDYFIDGVHTTAAGSVAWATLVRAAVE
jgi:lysophospholipase L1-like esterase